MADNKDDMNPNIVLKSAKNMAGYAEDKEIDPKLLRVGELVREAAQEDCEPEGLSDDELMQRQDAIEEALEQHAYKAPIA